MDTLDKQRFTHSPPIWTQNCPSNPAPILRAEAPLPATHKSLTPRYAEKFRCIGPACEDDCCHSWDITLDRPTYERYRALPAGPLRTIVDASVLLRTQTPATAAQPDRFYGEVKLLPDGACPFLSADRLCRIHTELGPESLSSICASFPRRSRSIDHQPETTLQLSCPEAARLVLLNPRFMHLPDASPGGRARYAPFARIAAALPPPNGNPYQYLWELRHLHLLLLKDRTYPLWQRLFILGLVAKRLTTIGTASENDTVPALLRSYAELLQQGRLRSALAAVPAKPDEHLALVLGLLERRAALGPIPPRLLDCIRSFMAGIGYTPGQPISAALPGYLAAASGSASTILQRHEPTFENYLVSYILLNRYPHGDDLAPIATGTTPTQEHALMCLRYAIIRALATGMAAHHEDAFAPSHLVKLIQSFSKSFEHNLDVRSAMVDLIVSRELASTAGLALLLRI